MYESLGTFPANLYFGPKIHSCYSFIAQDLKVFPQSRASVAGKMYIHSMQISISHHCENIFPAPNWHIYYSCACCVEGSCISIMGTYWTMFVTSLVMSDTTFPFLMPTPFYENFSVAFLSLEAECSPAAPFKCGNIPIAFLKWQTQEPFHGHFAKQIFYLGL